MENPDYLAACEQLEKEMTFGDIPIEDKLHEVEVPFNRDLMDAAYERIELCRKWLNEFAKANEPKVVNLLA